MAERRFKIELLDPQKLISVNSLRAVTNPIFFKRDNIPTDDGLLSNDIFGVSKFDRAGRFAYIELEDYFLHPLLYIIWGRMDSRIKDIVHGTRYFKIDENGELIEDPENGKTGLSFLKANVNKLSIRRTDSKKRDVNIALIQSAIDSNLLFIKQCIVIPAYYRDVNTNNGYVGVGEINQMYNSLMISVRGLKETQDYGLPIGDASKGRIQEMLTRIYNWFVQEPQLAKKNGIIRRAKLSKTADYASRLVISAPNLDADNVNDLMVDLDHSAVPLASVCANLYPYIIFNLRRLFDNEFSNGAYPIINKDGGIEYVKVKDYQTEFSDQRLKKEVDRFIRGYSNRFIPIEVPNEEGKKIFMRFKGYKTPLSQINEPGQSSLVNRRLTWCDLIYIAAVEAAVDKHVLITRYPLEDYFGQFPTKVVVSSTKETENMYIDNILYKHYPKIREEDIGSNTSNRFIDTLMICNLYLKAIGGDYDGDQVTVKAAFTIESNRELDNYMNSKFHFISVGGTNIRVSTNEAIQVLYNLTKCLDESRMTQPVF